MIKDLYSIKYHKAELTEAVRQFIVDWHYSKSYRSLMQKYVFSLRDRADNIIGVAVFGRPFSARAMDKYGPGTIELRRLCLIDDTPKNTESYFIAQTLRWLKHNTDVKRVISYADPNIGHTGTIYKAANFVYLGQGKSPNPAIIKLGDKTYHVRHMYQKKNGSYLDRSLYLQDMVRKGIAKKIKQENKHVFLYEMER